MPDDLLSLADYYARLSRHDWWYSYSDDPGVYRRGADERAELERIGHRSAEHANLFRAFASWKFGTADKPPMPQTDGVVAS